MPLTDRAYWPGDDDHEPEDRPRCMAKPTAEDIAKNRAMRRDIWDCALWEGHETDSNPRHQPHGWVQTGEDD